jgi:SAM-dependent methyltransferase
VSALSVRILVRGLVRNAMPAPLLAALRGRPRSGVETLSARYCYAVWLRHLVKATENGDATDPLTVAELGPGASLGVGIAALLTGAKRYVALDVVHHAGAAGNLNVFDELVELLANRAPIPGAEEFPEVRPALDSLEFPDDILTDARLSRCLALDRLSLLRETVRLDRLEYVVPWDDAAVLEPATIDLVFSQAVMEHVADLQRTYGAVFQWLKPGGLMSHQIDFRSHGTSPDWNGHWAYPRWLWHAAQGSPINRQPLSRHLEAIERAGFSIVAVQAEHDLEGLERRALAADWRWLSDSDMRSRSAFIQAVRPVGKPPAVS